VRGRFEKFTGTIDFDPEKPEQTSVDITIDAASINTFEAQRDAHLRSADFLDVENYPEITFRSKRVELIDDHHAKLYGDLTIRGKAREVQVDVEHSGVAKSPWGTCSAGFTAETTINRKDYGLEWNQLLYIGSILVVDEIRITIELEMTRQKHEAHEEEVAI